METSDAQAGVVTSKAPIASEGYAKVWLANGQTVRCAFYGYISESSALTVLKQIKRQVTAIVRARKQPALLLVDISGVTGQSRRARQVAKEIGGLPFDKIAVFGGGRLLTRLATYTLRFAHAAHYVKIFRTEVQAKRWLRQQNKLPGAA